MMGQYQGLNEQDICDYNIYTMLDRRRHCMNDLHMFCVYWDGPQHNMERCSNFDTNYHEPEPINQGQSRTSTVVRSCYDHRCAYGPVTIKDVPMVLLRSRMCLRSCYDQGCAYGPVTIKDVPTVLLRSRMCLRSCYDQGCAYGPVTIKNVPTVLLRSRMCVSIQPSCYDTLDEIYINITSYTPKFLLFKLTHCIECTNVTDITLNTLIRSVYGNVKRNCSFMQQAHMRVI